MRLRVRNIGALRADSYSLAEIYRWTEGESGWEEAVAQLRGEA